MARSAVAIILGAELRAWGNRLSKGNSGRTVLVAIFLAVGAVVLGGTMFALAVAASGFVPYARDPMLVGAFTALSVLMLVVGFPTVIGTFFVGPDLIQLLLAPIKPAEIFIARSILAMRSNLLLGFVIAAFVLGVGAGANASPIFYFGAIVFILLQVLTVTGLQAILMSIVIRWVPARLARDVAVVVASMTGAGVYLLWNLTLRQTVGRPGRPDVSGLVFVVQRIDWLPTAWPGHALSGVIDGSVAGALAWTAMTVVFATVLIAAASLLYGQTMLAGLNQLGGVQSRWRARSVRTEKPVVSGTVSPEMAIARKDWLIYRRDIRRLGRLLPAMIFLVAYAFVLVRPSRGISTFWYDVFIVTFISMFMSMAVATSSIPSERRGFQLLRLAPITVWQVIRAKILLTLLPVIGFIVIVSIVVAIAGHNGFAQVLQLAFLALWLSIGFVAIGVSVGGIDPRFEANDERRMVGPGGTVAGIGAELGFGGLSVVAFLLLKVAADVVLGTARLGPLPTTHPWAAGYAGIAVVLAAIGAAVVGLLLRAADARLRAFEASIAST